MNRTEEISLIDHEAVRAIGETMAQNIGALAAQAGDREATVATLNECAERVPYNTLFAENDQLVEEMEQIDSKRQAIDDTLRAEETRLGQLVATFATKKSDHHEAAKAVAEKKRAVAHGLAEAEKAPLTVPYNELTAQHDQLSETIESVAMAWPVGPYSEEVLRAAADKYPERFSEEDEFGWDDDDGPMAGEVEFVAAKRQAIQEVVVLGPYADLAARIPSLTERLQGAVSEHLHAYGEIETAKTVLDRAAAKSADERTEEEDNITRAVFVLRRRFLEDPNDLSFLDVYEADDIFQLTQALNKFSRKNRPDFDDIEGRILDKAASYVPLQSKEVAKDVQGAIDRMTQDKPGRRGMTWQSLAKHASRACDTMRARFFAGGTHNVHLKNYIIDVGDRSGTKPDISWIYQFLTDEFAFNVLAERRSVQHTSAEERFTENCAVIKEWLAEANELLLQMPEEFRLQRHEKRRRGRYGTRHRRAAYENATAYTSITNATRDIEIRQMGTGDSRTPRHKPVKADSVGALNHQLRLGHMINRLKEELAVYDAPEAGHTEEITPF